MLIQEGIENWTAPEWSKSSNHGARRLFFGENDCFIQKNQKCSNLIVFTRLTWSVKETKLCIMVQVQDVSGLKTVNGPPERISSN